MQVPLEFPPGLVNYDDYQHARNRWISSSNIRFHKGKPETLGGWAKMFASALSGVPRKMIAFNRSGTATMAYGTSTKLYVATGAAQPTDRSPVGLGSGIEAWSLDAWGSTLLAAPKGGTLYEQTGTSTATEVTQAPDVITCMLVSSERRQVIVFGCNEEVSGTFNGLCIRWCDFEDYTDWTTTATNNAGEHVLPGVGQIVGARLVGSSIWVWTDNSLWEGSFLGDPAQTYSFRLIDDNSGLVGQNAVDVIGARAFWIRPDLSLVTAAPGEPPRSINDDYPLNSVNATSANKIVLGTNQRFDEVWVHYPVSVGGENSVGTIYNYRDNVASRIGFGRSAILDDGVLRSVLGGTYQSNIIAAGSDGYVYVHETGSTGDGSAIDWTLTSGFVQPDSQRRVMLRQIVANIATSGSLTMQINTYNYPGSEAVENSVSVSIPRKSVRISGKYFTLSITGTAAARIGEIVFDIIPLGLR